MFEQRKASVILPVAWAVLAVLVSGQAALGQIELRPSYRVHEPVEVKVAGEPDVVLWRLPQGISTISQDNGRKLYVWAPVGRHLISVSVLTIDWEGKKVSAAEHSATLVIEGIPTPPVVVPDPIIPPPVVVVPPVAGKRLLVIVQETQQTTPELANLVNRLRGGDSSKYLSSKGHSLKVLDKDQLNQAAELSPDAAKWRDKVTQPLPSLLIVDQSTFAVLSAGSLPPSDQAVIELLKQHGG